MKEIIVVYTGRGKRVIEKLDFKSETKEKIARIMKLYQVRKE